MTTQPTPAESLPIPAWREAIRVAVGELRGSWPWLAEHAVPGPSTPPGERYQSPDQLAIEEAQGRKDRRARFEALRRGTVVAPHADAARIGPLAERPVVAGMVRRAAERMWEAQHDQGQLAWPVTDPRDRPITRACWYCEGRGQAVVLDVGAQWTGTGYTVPEKLPGVMGTCPECEGRRQVPTGLRCPACLAPGQCGCDHDDAWVYAALDVITACLPRLDDQQVAAVTLAALERADRAVRRAVHAEAAPLALKAPCPACGRRELVVDCTSPDEAEWAIRCASLLCQCRGAGCGCGRPVRYQGRRHLWPSTEWHGATGLAGRLGVDLAALARGEHAAAGRRGARIRSGRAGHGGWQAG